MYMLTKRKKIPAAGIKDKSCGMGAAGLRTLLRCTYKVWKIIRTGYEQPQRTVFHSFFIPKPFYIFKIFTAALH